jgi:phthiocerol/phenolphthiocerol synthesis type-I polyketide synthase E
MAIRCPGAENVEQFWSNLKNGVESITIWSDEELREGGIPDSVLKLPTFVKASAPLPGLELFDAEFFGYSAREAEFIDPQHRVFLECAVEALETAGIDPARHRGSISVFAGEGQTLYGYQILPNKSVIGVDRQMAVIGNDKDYLATRASYKLGLRGPSFTVQCACSTSTVAIHLAVQSLLSHESDAALCGGVSVSWIRSKGGYHFVAGGILSRDGHTRTFDADASGTIFADGVGLVVLKRLEDAIADGDDIQSVILGTAANNDGDTKVSYTAPGVEGQSRVFAEALAVAGVSPDEIGYIEAHGTGTALGDPIEVEALQRVIRSKTNKKQYCGIGSLKSNLGHLNTISGLAALIKASRSVKTGEIPPTLHYKTPNPKIDFANSPFFVPTELSQWTGPTPRRAGVSAFGIGGTNTEIIIEQPPPALIDPSSRSMHVAIVSAKNPTALDAASTRLAEHLRKHPEEDIADVCYTLTTGRTLYQYVRAVVCADGASAAEALESGDPSVVAEGTRNVTTQPVTFLFSGQGSQHIFMGRELYNEEPVFRAEIDRCAKILKRHIDIDIRKLLFPAPKKESEAEELLRNTQYAQPAIFVVSYALARLWMKMGARPSVMLGHSIGEFAAACIAEVFSLEDALHAVAERGRLMQSMPRGAMLSIMSPAQEVEPLLPSTISVAAINSPTSVVVAGPIKAVAALGNDLQAKGISSTPLHTSHAFHSSMMDRAVGPFVEVMRSLTLKAPQLPYISNVSGDWITDEQATDPAYWGLHLRSAVQFYKGLSTIQDQFATVFLEVGPSRALGTLARSLIAEGSGSSVQSSLPHAALKGVGELKSFLRAGAEIWLAGVPIEWERRYHGERRRKRALPTYPFARQRYWALEDPTPVLPPASAQAGASAARPAGSVGGQPAPVEANYLMETVSWKRVQYAADSHVDRARQDWLVFVSGEALDRSFADALGELGRKVTIVEKGDEFKELGERRFALNVNREADLDKLCAQTVKGIEGEERLQVIYFCDPSHPRPAEAVASEYRREVDDKLNAPITLVRSLMQHADAKNVSLTIITRDGHSIAGIETIDPMMALPIGPCLAGMHEYPNLGCRVVDVGLTVPNADKLARQLIADIPEPAPNVITAYRGGVRWARTIEPVPPFLVKDPRPPLRENGVYLITGGLGDLGLAIAEHLAGKYHAALVLISRTPAPPREEWSDILASSEENSRTVRIIRGIERIEAAGGKVMVGSADVSDLAQMDAVVRDACAEFGDINAIIHAAGVSGTTPIGLKTPEEVDQVLGSKILGLAVLEQVFADRDLDFVALFSSTSAIWGRVGQVDYTAANAYLDAWSAAALDRSRWPVISMNWDNWREVGMAVNTLRLSPGQDKSSALKVGLTTAEGIRAFDESLVARHTQVIVRGAPPGLRKGQAGARADGAGAGAKAAAAKPKAKRYPRPALAQAYRAAGPGMETELVDLWTDLLLIAPIGADDNFFELGGHSLLALQLLPKVRDKFQIALEPRELFANPTVAKLVAHIQNKR